LVVGINCLVVGREEPGLENRFGAEYLDYSRNVPRWIPRIQGYNAVQKP
jgi:protein-S-isoprenylcysteine O-methyltransferase Ste14